jgi:O-antigen ligase
MTARALGLVVAGVLFARFLAARDEARAPALKALIAAAFLAATLAVVGRFGLPELLGLVRGRGWVEPSIGSALKAYGSVAACLVPVALWAGWRSRGGWLALGLLHAPLALAVMVGGPSHSGLFGAAIMAGFGVCALLLNPGLWLNAALALLSAALLAGVGLALAQIPPLPAPESLGARVALEPFEVEPPAAFLDPHRRAIWGFTRDRALEAPVLGHGPDVSNRLPGASTVIEGFEQEFIPGHPHNWALELFVDTGGVGLAAMLLVLVLIARRLARAELPRPERAAGVALFGAFWGSSFFNFSFWENWWQATLLVLLTLIAAGPQGRRRALANKARPGKNASTRRV